MARPKKLSATMETVLHIRVTEEQKVFLSDISSVLGVSPSEYVRMLVNANYSAFLASREEEDNL